MTPASHHFRNYSLALLALALATLVRWLLNPWLGDYVPFPTFFAAVAFVGLFGGLGPAVLTLVAGGVVADIMFIPPRGQLDVRGAEHLVGLVLFFFTSAVIVALTERLRASNSRLHESKREAESRGELLRRITDAVPMLFFYVDEELRYQYVNARYEAWFETTAETVRGRHVKELMRETDYRLIEPHLSRALAGRPVDFELELVVPSLGRRLLQVHFLPDKDDSRVRGFFAVAVDQTELRNLAARDAQLAAIVTTAQEAILTQNLDGVVTSWNPGAEQVYGYSAEEMIGASIARLAPLERVQETRWITEEARAGHNIAALETMRLNRDGCALDVLLSAAPIRDEAGGVTAVATIERDITRRKRAEEALRRSEAVFRRLAETNLLGVAFGDASGKLSYVNDEMLRMMGCTHAEFEAGRVSWVKRLAPECREAALRIGERLLEAGEVSGYELAFVRPDGSRAPFVGAAAIPVPGEDFRIAVALDLTKVRTAEASLRESEERFRTLADHMAQLAWMADAEGRMFWYNKRWYDYTGTTLEEARGWGWTKVHHPDHVKRVVVGIQRSWDTGQPWEDLFPLRGRDGQYRWFLSRALPIRDEQNRVVRWFGTNTDVTEQRAAEEALRQADRRKDQFLSMLAHELRNPLAPIVNAVEVLRLQRDTGGSRLEWAVDVIDRQAKHLARLVDDLLDIARINSGRIQLRREVLEMAAVLSQAANAMRPRFEARGVCLTVSLAEQPLRVHADAGRIRQVIDNLVDNAAKYTEPGGSVYVDLRRDGEQCVLCVRDTGVGIDPDHLPRVFDLFEQVEASLDRSEGGLGLGLNLVKRLVTMHDGHVEAHSEGSGRGSEFVVRLPLADEQTAAASTAAAPMQIHAARRILVIDDNADVAQSMGMLLQTLGHEVRSATGGRQGVEMAERFRPQIVLIDIGLPDMNGYEVAGALRARFGRAVCLIAVTGYGQDAYRVRAKEAGFDAHLVKPVTQNTLAELLSDPATRLEGESKQPAPPAPCAAHIAGD